MCVWEVFKIQGFVCKRFLPSFPFPFFYSLHFSRCNSLLSPELNPTETLVTQAMALGTKDGASKREPILVPRATILLTCGSRRDRELWLCPTPEVRDSRTSRQIWRIWLAENMKRMLCTCSENRDRPELSRGAFHSTKNSGLNFWNFRMSNGTVFSTRPDRSHSFPAWAHFPLRITRQNAGRSWWSGS